MAKTPHDLMGLKWAHQAEHLQSLSRQDLDILWFELQEERESFDRLYLAVYSILRDLYEAESKARAGAQVGDLSFSNLIHAENHS